MHHFTERFKSRLVEMATSEFDLSVRVAAISVLCAIDRHGLLEDEQRDEIAQLVYDVEPRVRRAAGQFFAAMMNEDVEDRKVDLQAIDPNPNIADTRRKDQLDVQHKRLKLKCLAALLVKLGTQLETKSAEETADYENGGNTQNTEDNALEQRQHAGDAAFKRAEGAASASQLTAVLQGQQKDRISWTVESLWNDIEILRDWQAILEYVLLDHSATEAAEADIGTGRAAEKGKGRAVSTMDTAVGTGDSDESDDPQMADNESLAKANEPVEKTCRLLEQEENLMLGVLVSAIKVTRHRASLLAKKAGSPLVPHIVCRIAELW